MTKEENETRGYELGKVAGIEMAANFLDGMAIEHFTKRKEDEAIRLRQIANKLIELAKKKRQEYDKKYPKD